MVVDTGSKFWKLEGNIWRVNDSMTRENGWRQNVERKKDRNGKIIQYSSRDWFTQGKKPGGVQWNPEGDDGFKGNKAKAWTKGIVGMLTGNEKIMDAAFHGSTDDFLKSTGEGMSDTELAINLAVIGGGIVGGIASSRAGVRSGHAESGNLKAMKAKYKISKAQVFEEAKQQGKDLSKVEESRINSFIEEWNKRDPVDNVKIADTYLEKQYQDLNTKAKTNLDNKPQWKGGSWDRANPSDKSAYTTKYNIWKTTKATLEAQIEKVGNKFSKVRQAYNRLKAARDKRLAEEGKTKAEANVKKFEKDNNLEELTFMEYLQNFKKLYNKNPTEAELADFKVTFNKFRVDLKNVDSAIRETATENYKAAGESDPTSTYFRMWEDIKSKNNGKIDLKAFEDQIKTESLEAFRSARASRIKAFENQHGLKQMTIEEYIYKYQENNNGYRPNRAQLKKFIADYNDYRIDLNSISESTKVKIMEDYEAGGEKTPNLFEVWEVNKAKGGVFEESLLKDAAQSRRAAEYTQKIESLKGLDKNGDGKLTKEEVKEFNKKFDFDADGILGKEEKAAKTAEIEEKYGDLDAEERRLLEDDEVEVDLFGDGEETAGEGVKGGKSGKTSKVGAGAAGAGAVAAAVASAVGSKDVDEEKVLPDNLPENRRRMIEFDLFDILVNIFGNPYFYPAKPKFISDTTKLKKYENTNPPFIQNVPPNNPFDTQQNQPVNINTVPFHPDIKKSKAIELCLKSLHAYEDTEQPGSILISSGDFIDAQARVYTESLYKVVAFRGTEITSAGDILTDVWTFSARLSSKFPFIQQKDDLIVHGGFLYALSLLYDNVKQQLETIENFEITGHSLGCALAILFTYVYSVDTGKFPLHAFGFGSPRVIIGKESTEKYNKRIDFVRFQNNNDGVTFIPTQEISLQGVGTMTAGATAATTLASYLGKPNTGMITTLGALAAIGLGRQSNPLEFLHVGLGIMLFERKNEVVNIRDSDLNPGMRVVPETYIFIPEGEDIMRNPLNIEGLIVKEITNSFVGRIIQNNLLGDGGFDNPLFQDLFKSYYENPKFGIKFLDKAFGFYQLFVDSHSILLTNKYTDVLLDKVRKHRRDAMNQRRRSNARLELELEFQPVPYASMTSENLFKFSDDILALNRRFLERPEVDRLEYYQSSTTSLLDSYSISPLFAEYLTDVKKLMNNYFREQNTEDFFHLRDCFARYHLYTLLVGTNLCAKGISAYLQYDGHIVSTYMRRLNELPDILYNGENIPETITDQMSGGGEGNINYNTYSRNPYMPNSRHYYDQNGKGHYLNNFNQLKRTDEILGFIFYKDDTILNKLILY